VRRAVVRSDGASSGNPGHSGIGGVVRVGDETREFSRYIGVTTNNVAEYTAFLTALEQAKEMGATEVEAFLDSELVVKQINGEYRVKHDNIKPLYGKVMQLLSSFGKYSVRHVPREANKRADTLSKEALKKTPPARGPLPSGQGTLF
jgi:ribonuclease HI